MKSQGCCGHEGFSRKKSAHCFMHKKHVVSILHICEIISNNAKLNTTYKLKLHEEEKSNTFIFLPFLKHSIPLESV